ncbi:TatD family hydrolase [Desulfolithobacter sp.]
MQKSQQPPELDQDEETYLIDSHCHLDMAPYSDDLDQVLDQALQAGVRQTITIGIDYESSAAAVALAKRYDCLFATVGLHPHGAATASPEGYHHMEELAGDERVVGYGEIGLDYARNYAPRDVQLREFRYQLDMAKNLRLPVIIHDREAHDDTMRLLRQAAPFPAGGVMHCFSGDLALARQVIDLGLYISIPGIVTFKNARALQEVAARAELERIILETDGPFLAPMPFRGKRNQPGWLVYTAMQVARLRDTSLEEVARQTSANARNLFNLPLPGGET